MKAWSDTEQSWDSAPVVFHPTAPASAATCEHPEELKAPGVQSSPALVWARGKRSTGIHSREANHQHPAVT